MTDCDRAQVLWEMARRGVAVPDAQSADAHRAACGACRRYAAAADACDAHLRARAAAVASAVDADAVRARALRRGAAAWTDPFLGVASVRDGARDGDPFAGLRDDLSAAVARTRRWAPIGIVVGLATAALVLADFPASPARRLLAVALVLTLAAQVALLAALLRRVPALRRQVADLAGETA